MIDRYTLPEMARLWSDQHKLELWKEVETLVVHGLLPIPFNRPSKALKLFFNCSTTNFSTLAITNS